MRNQGGFTIYELMITIIVLSVLLAIGVPNMTKIITSNRLTTLTNVVVASLQFARSEALRRNAVVAVGATSTDWASGYKVWVDTNNNGVADSGETVLRQVNTVPTSFTLQPPASTTSAAAVRFLPNGFLASTTLTTQVCKSGEKGRVITVSVVGQVQTSEMSGVCS